MSTRPKNSREFVIPITSKMVNTLMAVCTLVALILFVVPFVLVWRPQEWLPSTYGLIGMVLALWVGVFLHETLHALGWMLAGKAPWNALRYGMDLSKGVAYVHSLVALDIRAYQVGVLVPWLVLGVIPGIVGLAMGSGYILAFGILMFGVSGGDLLIAWYSRSIPKGTLVLDHPTDVGFYLVDEETDVEQIEGGTNFKEFLLGGLKPLVILMGILGAGYIVGYGIGTLAGRMFG